MWTKNSIPAGWRLCNGSGGTPNLVNRFVVGAGHWYGIRSTGGVNSVALHYNHMPAHAHSAGAHGGATTGIVFIQDKMIGTILVDTDRVGVMVITVISEVTMEHIGAVTMVTIYILIMQAMVIIMKTDLPGTQLITS